MAAGPYFVLGPATVLSGLGLMRGPDRTVPTPTEDWRSAQVDVIIPALNEEEHIVLCLASVLRQTVRPRRIVLVDDGSSDRTIERAEAFCRFHGVDLIAIRRRKPIGKTPTIKRQARELDSDVEFILDADTVLESNNYIERAVQELYQAVGIASACGTILPLRRKDRRRLADDPDMRGFQQQFPFEAPRRARPLLHDFLAGVTGLYREVLYLFLQHFVYRGQMTFFGTITNPVGCAVAYRRKYVERLFDHFTPLLGDDLTNSEDIFIGFAMLDQGYRNIQLTDVYARTVEPEVQRLPRQVYLWSSAFLQSCYYFDPLLKSPVTMIKQALRRRLKRKPAAVPAQRAAASVPPQHAFALAGAPAAAFGSAGPEPRRQIFGRRTLEDGRAAGWVPLPDSLGPHVYASASAAARRIEAIEPAEERAPRGEETPAPKPGGRERRVIGEPYRQPFGRDRTRDSGRPSGWMLMMSAVEKVFFPTSLLIMMLLGNWRGLAVTIAVEAVIGVLILAIIMKGRRVEYLVKGLAIVPIRYALITSELVTLARFTTDLWITNNRRWRK
jgi:glycosyltransferase involved in cell wall biosynthesis